MWYYPEALLLNRDLVALTRERKEVNFGRAPHIEAFAAALVTVRQSDGVRKSTSVSPYATKLFDLLRAGRWDAALKLCRLLHDRMLWSCLAASSIKHNQLDKAEAAFAAIDQVWGEGWTRAEALRATGWVERRSTRDDSRVRSAAVAAHDPFSALHP